MMNINSQHHNLLGSQISPKNFMKICRNIHRSVC
jgi:hypothetical protein